MARRSKHMPYFALVEALGEDGCCLCRLISARTRRYLDGLLYELVNDGGFRSAWRRSRGFCHRHAWMLAESTDALGIGILYLDLVERYGEGLVKEPAGRGCAVCRLESRWLAGYVGLIEDFWDDDDFRRAMEESEGLCGPHLRAALKQVRRPQVREGLVRISVDVLGRLRRELRELVDGFDYRSAPSDDPHVKLAWRRAIEKVTGCRDLPGEGPDTGRGAG